MPFKSETYRAILYFLLLMMYNPASVSADTVIKNDGSELKGLVVEDYTDRIVVSTGDGEATIMKSQIKDVVYDDEEKNLLYLARTYYDKGKPTIALQYTDMALEVNPSYEEARNLRSYLSSKIVATKEDYLYDVIEQKKKLMSARGVAPAVQERKPSLENLKEDLGVQIISSEGWIVITDVAAASAAGQAGLTAQDKIVSIGGTLTRYWPLARAAEDLAGPRYSETLVAIERDVEIDLGVISPRGRMKKLGIKLSMEEEGLTIKKITEGGLAKASGLEEGDLVVKIDGASMRYTPLRKAESLISSAGQKITFTIRRKRFLWRR